MIDPIRNPIMPQTRQFSVEVQLPKQLESFCTSLNVILENPYKADNKAQELAETIISLHNQVKPLL